MGYNTNPGQLDISNSNTPGLIDPSNPTIVLSNPTNVVIAPPTFRNVAEIKSDGSFLITQTNAYSGNNGRAAIKDSAHPKPHYLMVGNAGNSGKNFPINAVPGNIYSNLSDNTGVQSIAAGQHQP